MWSAPSAELPGQPAVDRAELGVLALGRGRPGPATRRTWWPTRSGRSGCPRPAAPGRCRPCADPASPGPGRAAAPVRASHAMADARWAVTPTASTGPPSSRAALGHRRWPAAAMATGSNSTSPGIGTVGGRGSRWTCSTRGVGPHDGGADAAGPHVDHQDADGGPSLVGRCQRARLAPPPAFRSGLRTGRPATPPGPASCPSRPAAPTARSALP